MYQVAYQQEHKIEIVLSDVVTTDEFQQVIHQLESLAKAHQHLNVLIDAVDVKSFGAKVMWEQYEFFKNYKSHLQRLAVVSDSSMHKKIQELFFKFTDTEFRLYSSDELEKARAWIFPSRLPKDIT
ncbi:hypothetical protein GF406_09040 [candidate division KSB1 bacterium]|nr:hypothetical protein [candidate division KSB1 bacterium]